jgi:hypothetical protein
MARQGDKTDMLICEHCGSQMIAEDREFVSGIGWTIRKRCLDIAKREFRTLQGQIAYFVDKGMKL